ncbi:hypothetical protein PAXRUDRAFT_826697 [Paxillus rubicundulus Ve08.2h10]|uniref:SAC3/GANP/THP3 conserved domain-containing protein n=1 Tax=Paxillus rubicundulus Ve08.2h10 TaxID=930991 RepID=A0A0D0DZ79_9AGAM|nr:hypothetical protein PAXRUDRAFT_826697 [Paxillus rubicundulus Ve08.2h10]
MEPTAQRSNGGRPNGHLEVSGPGRHAHHGNKRWVAEGATGRSGVRTSHTGSDSERRERGGNRGGGRGRGRGTRGKFGNASVTFRRNGALDDGVTGSEGENSEMEDGAEADEMDSNELETPEEKEKFWQQLVKAREAERKKSIAEGKMDDPFKPKRLEDAITMVGTCLDMCPRFERYRRERENNLFEWESIPGTKRVDHRHAVKMYERAAGDKTLPSDLRPPNVLKRTLDYLFHDLLPRGGFSATFNFIRDRSRAVRNDFTMQHEMGQLAIECHDRCARFHILALHIERARPGFSIAMEEQQLMNTLQSLKEFYQDQRGQYQSPTELEMRVYHRLVHIRDQRERHDDIPPALLNHPVFELTTKFRGRVQAMSAPITKSSLLVVDAEAMKIFAELANVLRREGNVIMTYLVACILERHFGTETIEDIESIRGDLSLSAVIDGFSGTIEDTDIDISLADETEDYQESIPTAHPPLPQLQKPLQPSGMQRPTDTIGKKPSESAFFSVNTPEAPSQPVASPMKSAFSNLKAVSNAFGTTSFDATSAFMSAPSAPPSIVTAPPSGPFGFSTTVTPRISSTPPAVPISTDVQAGTVFTPPFGQPPLASGSRDFPPTQPPQAHSSAFIPANSPAHGSELSTLNPLAAIFTPLKPPPLAPSTPTSVFDTSGTLLFSTPPANGMVPSTESHRQSVPSFGVMEDALSKLQTPSAQPPPLNRRQPVSLPSTPTATAFIPTFAPQRPKSIFGSLKNIQTSSLSAVPTEILSPLVLQSPGSNSFSSIPRLLRRDSAQSPLRAAVSAADIEAKIDASTERPETSVATGPSPVEKPTLDIMKATADGFARGGWVVREYFSRWQQRLVERARWIEACRRSTAYKEKVQAERLSRSVSSPSEKKRKTAPRETPTPIKKRLRSRLSSDYKPPQNDEELAKRFEKNQAEHARRWSRGSFLRVLQDFLDSTTKPLPENWSAWLSFNQESDGTAIWLEQKFDVPNSGQWKDENVFQIPVSRHHTEPETSYPGVVIFERTPLAGVTDILGKKYRVLEDCARLREIIGAFPSNRHYVPSLLCILWSEREANVSKDFDDMVNSMVGGGMLTSTHDFLISTAALDMESKLEELLHVIPFDVEARLVKWLSINDLFKTWEHSWDEMTARWLNNCTVYGEFHWDLHSNLLAGCARLLIHLLNEVTGLLGHHVLNDLPGLQVGVALDSEMTFDTVLEWLQALPETNVTLSLLGDIRAHQSLGRDFPTMTFLPQIYALARSIAAHIADVNPDISHCISRARLDEALSNILRLMMSLEDEMKANHIAKLKPAKRLASFEETGSSRSSTPSSFDETIVTPAMLRSLTKNIRATYGS